jgi:inhibitor of KinA sporulation pathway (predicted exonuclease)
MKILSLDLEMNQPSGKIIQIGAVVGDLDSGVVVERFGIFVECNEPLNPEITKLTGITVHDLSRGVSLPAAYSELLRFHEKHRPFCNPLTWGGGDSAELKKQLDGSCTHWVFGRRWIDVKTIYQTQCIAGGKPLQGGLARVMTKYGLKFKGRKHNAVDDAENTFLLYFEMLKMFKVTSNPKQSLVGG